MIIAVNIKRQERQYEVGTRILYRIPAGSRSCSHCPGIRINSHRLRIFDEILRGDFEHGKHAEPSQSATLGSAARNGPRPSEEAIEWNDIHWTPLTAEPRGIDYIEVDAYGVPAMWIRPKGAVEDRVIFYSHGGGFVSGSIYTHRKLVGHLAKASGCRGLLFDFPYAHERKHPAQLETAEAVYRWLLDQHIKAEHVVAAGESAGAILTVGLLQRARESGFA